MLKENLNSESNTEKGQSLVEFALFASILIIMLTMLLDLGRAYFAYLALQSAAGEGAAYGLIYPTWHDSSDNPDPNNITYRARHEAPSGLISWSDSDVNVEVLFPTPGNNIAVSIYSDYKLITPFAQLLTGGDTIRLRATAVQSIISPVAEASS